MRSWLLSPVAAALIAAISMGFLFCPCVVEASEHTGCSETTTALRAVSDDCCEEQAGTNALLSFAPPAPPPATAAAPASAPASEVRCRVPQLISIHSQPLVLRI
jgi:hypothetical protein